MRQPLRLRDDGATSGPAVPAAEEEGASTPR
jgi:hypothetical protein